MRPTKTMTVARRLGLGFAFVGALAVATALAGAWGLSRSEAHTQTIYEDRTVALQQLGEVNYLTTRSRVVLMDAVLHAQPEKALARVKQYEAARAGIDKTWKT